MYLAIGGFALRALSPVGLQPSQETLEEDANPNHSNGKDREARPFDAQNIRNVIAMTKEPTDAERQFAVSIKQKEEQNM
jgi:hypothetical protein